MGAAKKKFENISTDRVYGTIAEATAEPADAGTQLAFNEELEVIEPQETEEVQEVLEVQNKRKPYKNRKTYSEQETLEAMHKLKTQGLKGVKLPRINMAFTPENYDYIVTMSRANGVNMTQLLNNIIDVSRERNEAAYNKAKQNREEFIF